MHSHAATTAEPTGFAAQRPASAESNLVNLTKEAHFGVQAAHARAVALRDKLIGERPTEDQAAVAGERFQQSVFDEVLRNSRHTMALSNEIVEMLAEIDSAL